MVNLSTIPSEQDLKQALPSALKESLELLQQDFVDIDTATILNFLVCNFIRMFSSKKITIDEAGNKLLMNWFSLIFMDSGYGKDRIASTIDHFYLKQYKEWFNSESLKLYKEQMKEYEENKKNKDEEKEVKPTLQQLTATGGKQDGNSTYNPF